jgi:hypothetical protein
MQHKYEVRITKRSKRLRLSVEHTGKIVVTAPSYISESVISQFVAKHSDWIKKRIVYLEKHPAPLLVRYSTRDYALHKEKARVLVQERVHFFAEKFGYAFGSIRIGNQKSRWGSCSRRGNLNFNYKIVFLPKELQDYIVVHELCHLKEMNHSPRFWALVEQEIPNWKQLKKELKRY